MIFCPLTAARKPFLLALLACGCAHEAVSASPPAIGDPVRVHVAADAHVRPATVRVSQGTPVRIEITAERAVTVHLHGYDIERHVAPGTAATAEFEATATGRFPMTTHEAAGTAMRERVLLYLEVHPR